MCSEHAYHPKLNDQHDWGDLHDHLMNMKIFDVIMTKIFIRGTRLHAQFGHANHFKLVVCLYPTISGCKENLASK